MTRASEPSAALLRGAIESLGLRCTIEVRGRLAVLRASGEPIALADPELRERIVLLAREHGFTHAALELDG